MLERGNNQLLSNVFFFFDASCCFVAFLRSLCSAAPSPCLVLSDLSSLASFALSSLRLFALAPRQHVVFCYVLCSNLMNEQKITQKNSVVFRSQGVFS